MLEDTVFFIFNQYILLTLYIEHWYYRKADRVLVKDNVVSSVLAATEFQSRFYHRIRWIPTPPLPKPRNPGRVHKPHQNKDKRGQHLQRGDPPLPEGHNKRWSVQRDSVDPGDRGIEPKHYNH